MAVARRDRDRQRRDQVTLKGGDIEATFEGRFSPTALPKKGTAPVGLNLEGYDEGD